MIKIVNDNDINEYTALNKVYIPNQHYNQNYTYRINGDIITIITNRNCTTQYNSTYCDCMQYYYKLNLVSNTYSCNTNNNNPVIPFTSITNDINYSEHIKKEYNENTSILLLMVVIGIIFASLLTKRRNY